jgi:hypothetical protein
MMRRDDSMNSHTRTLEALPWLVNGSPDHPDLADARAHLARCPECQQWHAFELALASHLREEPVVDQAPHAAFARFIQRLDADESRRKLRERWFLPFIAFGRRVSLRNLPLIIALQAVVIAGLSVALVMQQSTTPRAGFTPVYRTLTSAPALPDAGTNAMLRLVVDERMTAGELTSLLASVNARIVDGPNELGVFTIEIVPAGSGARPDALALAKQLRDRPGVRFAEPTGVVRLER